MYGVSLVCYLLLLPAAFNILSLCLVFVSLISMCLGMFLLGFILYGTFGLGWLSPFPCWRNTLLTLAGSHSPHHLPRMPSNTVLISGLTEGAAQILIWPSSYVFLPPVSQLSELVHFLLWELSMIFYIFHRHRVCLVDHMDLICSLYSWWEGFGSASLATLPLSFNCGFISTSTCGPSTGVCS